MSKHDKINITLAAAVIGCAAIIGVPAAMAAEPMPSNTTLQPDNTGINKLDRNAGGITADQQSAAKPDREITRQIRKAIMANKGLSTYAHNVKIITARGAVTIKGPVRSDAERQAVLDAAKQVTNGANVVDQMSIKPKK